MDKHIHTAVKDSYSLFHTKECINEDYNDRCNTLPPFTDWLPAYR